MKLLIASLLLACAAGAAHAADRPQPAEAVLVSAPAQAVQTVIDGRLWRCLGTGCRAQPTGTAASQSVARECRRVAAELGALSHYRTGRRVFTPAELANCNTAAKPTPANATAAER
jgi:hypothetical protein